MNHVLLRGILATATILSMLLQFAQGQLDGESPRQVYPGLDHFQAITQRPLFEESRRPLQRDETPTATGTTAQALRAAWRLTGVVWEGEQQLALFSERQGEGRRRLKTGLYLDRGWQLEEIQAEAVILSDGSQQLVLELREPRPQGTEPEASRSNTGSLPTDQQAGQANAEIQ
ncbi:hypothetical protein [Oceanisphaera sp. IT1-181]|uniref:hypothetical protein n=1 Tax=Oceanisphaera sp. IT1-181 TaxID=3081199 RepID=UPI0029C9BB41|nr:hypothetical protein [Oceanisphaera sp. IT1-181]